MMVGFDELNTLVQNERSMPFEMYFGEMNLPEEEKSERIQMAKELEEVFITTMIWLFTIEQANNTNYEPIRQCMEDDYMEVLRKYVEVDDYLKTYNETMGSNH